MIVVRFNNVDQYLEELTAAASEGDIEDDIVRCKKMSTPIPLAPQVMNISVISGFLWRRKLIELTAFCGEDNRGLNIADDVQCKIERTVRGLSLKWRFGSFEERKP